MVATVHAGRIWRQWAGSGFSLQALVSLVRYQLTLAYGDRRQSGDQAHGGNLGAWSFRLCNLDNWLRAGIGGCGLRDLPASFVRYAFPQSLHAGHRCGEFHHLHFLATLRIRSREYHYAYYYTDSLLTILMFFVIIQLYQQVLAQMNASGYIRRAATIVLAATSLFSYLVVYRHRANLTDQFVVAFGQNLYFVGVVLTYVLWAAIFKLGETRRRLVHFVLALGIYFSGIAGAYALRHLFPERSAA